jgi:DNA-binding HxlR family transcriptional regulator
MEIQKLSHQEIFRRRQNVMKAVEGSQATAAIFIGRWTPKILFSLHGRPYRHGELRRQLGRVSQRMLTRTLRNLESTGLIARRVTISKAIAVEYSLTKLGRTIIAPLRGMCRWARRYGRKVSAEVHLGQSETSNAKKLS